MRAWRISFRLPRICSDRSRSGRARRSALFDEGPAEVVQRVRLVQLAGAQLGECLTCDRLRLGPAALAEERRRLVGQRLPLASEGGGVAGRSCRRRLVVVAGAVVTVSRTVVGCPASVVTWVSTTVRVCAPRRRREPRHAEVVPSASNPRITAATHTSGFGRLDGAVTGAHSSSRTAASARVVPAGAKAPRAAPRRSRPSSDSGRRDPRPGAPEHGVQLGRHVAVLARVRIGAWTCADASAVAESDANGRSPVRRLVGHDTERIPVAGGRCALALRLFGREIPAGGPSTVPVIVIESSPTALATPKSATATSPRVESRFPGLTSRWTTPAA